MTDHEVAPLVDLAVIRAAAATLRGIAVRTPLVGFGPPSDRMLLKAESRAARLMNSAICGPRNGPGAHYACVAKL